MKKYNIDGVFLKRPLRERQNISPKDPEWVLGNVRAAANRENRVWAIEYDLSGFPEETAYALLEQDWKWLVDEFGLLKDPTYLHENGKPVVFVWGPLIPDRQYKVATAQKIAQFLKEDPVYGGNYLIGAIPVEWRTLTEDWKGEMKRYDCLQVWGSDQYRENQEELTAMGIAYLPKVSPGFSWANLMQLPESSSDLIARRAGQKYWDEIVKACAAKVDRLYVSMFDKYYEGTAIMPMSDDTPPLSPIPGVIAKYYPRGELTAKPIIKTHPLPGYDLTYSPVPGVMPQDYRVTWEGLLVPPSSGNYTMIVKGAPEDEVSITISGSKVVNGQKITADSFPQTSFTAGGKGVPFQIEYRHFKGVGKVEVLWKSASGNEEIIPAAAYFSQTGRFIGNEGKPSDWWMRLTGYAKEVLEGKSSASSLMPAS